MKKRRLTAKDTAQSHVITTKEDKETLHAGSADLEEATSKRVACM
jgi:hypothetical protein